MKINIRQDEWLKPIGGEEESFSLLMRWSRGLVGKMVTEIEREVAEVTDRRDKSKMKFSVSVILANSLSAIWKEEMYPGYRIVVKYSRNANEYRAIERYGLENLSYKSTIAAMDALERLGYLEQKISRPNSQFRSYFHPTPKLNALFMKHKHDGYHIQSHSKRMDIIRLKNKDKHLIDYKDTPETKHWRSLGRKYNMLLSQHQIALSLGQEAIGKMISAYGLNNVSVTETSVYGGSLSVRSGTVVSEGKKAHINIVGSREVGIWELGEGNEREVVGGASNTNRNSGAISEDKPYRISGKQVVSALEKVLLEEIRTFSTSDANAQGGSITVSINHLCGYYRVFNRSSFDYGGRWYAPLQSIPAHDDEKEGSVNLRRCITIGGESTTCLDFKGIHPSILYALEKMVYGGDDYYGDVRLEMKRDDLKIIFQVILNSKTAHQAAGRINSDAAEGAYDVRGYAPYEIIRAFKKAHAPIEKFLCHDYGTYLMRLDSEIATLIIRRCVEESIPMLAIHDGFVVRERDEEFLWRVMEESYLKVVNFMPKIKKEF